MHRILVNTFNIDVPAESRDATVAFWAAALGAEAVATRLPHYHILDNALPPNRVVVQAIDEGSPKMHFDIHTDDLQAEVDRLVANGATVVTTEFQDAPGHWVIMRDPAGMEFCVVWALDPIRPQAVRDDFERRARPVG